MNRMIYETDRRCVDELRMDLHTFSKLCSMLRATGRLHDTRNVSVDEMVAVFLNVLAHHKKNRVIQNDFYRSGETISRYFNAVLEAVLCLQNELLKTPEPVHENSTDERWKWFKNCLGALDETYIRLHVPEVDKPRYRTRKNEIATNVLGGSAADSRILRDAISRRHGLRVSRGNYYLVDAGYPNGEGFLAPRKMTIDPEENELNEDIYNQEEDDVITSIDSSEEWAVWRANLADHMFNEWRENRNPR
ncbi:hypothetical protein L3X38_024918 [Prunus dulcis]|uniref:DUF8040 domain-containing protein n=1 Tax=Prunus dulcis TaxID=3755 RepID=A0AAD4W0P3_PRUDU|nr:hypothetical protein L3X38_024918 [Prunus dulcis]